MILKFDDDNMDIDLLDAACEIIDVDDKWVTRTNSKGIVAKAGRYGGTYAYKDIAFEFASWVSPQFKLYLIKEFERLKKEEQALLGWSAQQQY